MGSLALRWNVTERELLTQELRREQAYLAEAQWLRLLAWTVIRSNRTRSRSRWFDVDGDVPPFSLPEAQYAQYRAREMTEDDGEPDVAGLQAAQRLEKGAQADGDGDLRHDGDVKRATRVARSLQATGVTERHRDEESGHGQVSKQLLSNVSHLRFGHAEDAEQKMRNEQEQGANHRGNHQADPRGNSYATHRPLGITCAQILSCDGGRGTHESNGCPCNERKQLGVANRVGRLGGCAVLQRADE